MHELAEIPREVVHQSRLKLEENWRDVIVILMKQRQPKEEEMEFNETEINVPNAGQRKLRALSRTNVFFF